MAKPTENAVYRDTEMLPLLGAHTLRQLRGRWRISYLLVAAAFLATAAYTFLLHPPVSRVEATVRALRALPNDFSQESDFRSRGSKDIDVQTITDTLSVVDALRHEFDRQQHQSEAESSAWLLTPIAALRSSFVVASTPTYPSCGASGSAKERYASLRQGGRIFIAINLLQNEELMPTLLRELPALLRELGPERFFVSVYENASMDLTVMHLRLLCKILDALGTPYRVIARGLMELQQKEHNHRISRLAHLRNTVLEPLFLSQNSTSSIQHGSFETVLFLNDVFHCHGDVLELLLEKKRNHATQACGLDFGPRGVIYDRWVIRTSRGTPFYRQNELVEFFGDPDDIELKPRPIALQEKDDKSDREALEKGDPFQVFSCWNGVTAFTAHDDPESKDGATDKASECYLSSVDLWKAGLGRIMVVPRARMAYSLDVYQVDRASSAYNTSATSSPLVKWSPTPPPEITMHNFGWWFAPETKSPWDAA
ncbi:hypothetical protein BDV93DRAFT_508560 [Ceratobasidium sp. AG-I]|nr:hypothetical protein BDV93DRAFT_508560 [Ceratobasidium sp. AG-I]